MFESQKESQNQMQEFPTSVFGPTAMLAGIIGIIGFGGYTLSIIF